MYVRDNKFRKLSGFESLLLQGFPQEIAKKAKGQIIDSHLLSQAGNAMTVSTIQSVGQSLLNFISN
jgi:DNA (cytosine-5)-methyltransferase 1